MPQTACNGDSDAHPAVELGGSPPEVAQKEARVATLRCAGNRDMLVRLQMAGPAWGGRDAIGTARGESDTDDDDDNDDDRDAATGYSERRHAREAVHLNAQLQLGRHSRPPRVLMVSRRHCRKNKYVDIVGEYHLDLVQESNAAAIVIPRTVRTALHLAEYLPMDGLIIAEGNDLSDHILQKYSCATPGRLEGELAQKYAGDTEFDVSKDELEFALMSFALAAGCPVLTLCRGCQMLNAMRGGTLVGDLESEVNGGIAHLRPSGAPDYDSYRHPIRVVPNTPLAEWFAASLHGTDELQVNSYHHQAVKDLGRNLREMARAPDGVIEGFYDADYAPSAGRFVVGLQFHPERMLSDYPGCAEVYRAFGESCHAYKARQERRHAQKAAGLR